MYTLLLTILLYIREENLKHDIYYRDGIQESIPMCYSVIAKKLNFLYPVVIKLLYPAAVGRGSLHLT